MKKIRENGNLAQKPVLLVLYAVISGSKPKPQEHRAAPGLWSSCTSPVAYPVAAAVARNRVPRESLGKLSLDRMDFTDSCEID